MCSCQSDSKAIIAPLDVDGYLQVKEEIKIGEDIRIVANIDDVVEDVDACVLFTSSLLDKIYCGTLDDGSGEFVISKEVNIQSGIITIDLLVQGKNISRFSTYVKAEDPVDIMEGFIGAKTLITDDEHPAMLVVIPIDRFNNFCEDSTEVIINSVNTKNQSRAYGKSTEQGLTYQLYDGLKTTAKTSIGATSFGAFLMEKEVKHVPGEPIDFILNTTNVYPFADGRQTFDVYTSTINDQFGNIVADGTVVDYIVSDKTGLSKFHSITTNGISNLLLRNPNEEIQLSIYAEVDGIRKSRAIQVYFKPYILNYATEYNPKSRVIKIGPISGSLGQIIPDGTVVTISIANENYSTIIDKQTLEGHVLVELDDYSLNVGVYNVVVNVSSNEKSIQVSI